MLQLATPEVSALNRDETGLLDRLAAAATEDRDASDPARAESLRQWARMTRRISSLPQAGRRP